MTKDDFISKDKRRPRMTVNGKTVPRSVVLWNKRHPNDLVKRGEVVHHKDGNPFNDSHDNHDKMTKTKHDDLHRAELTAAHVKARTGSKQSADWIRNRVLSYRGMRKWNIKKARMLKSKGLGVTAIERHFGIAKGTIYHWCRRNEVTL